ncbi:(Na+)-NQR maturation NqrM [Aliikangiella sp. IMCC44653]
MQLFLITFILMLAVVGIMAIGYILQRKQIKGSCGGIASLGLEKACDCDEPCDKRKELIQKMQQQQREESLIDIKVIENSNS